ncbi:hypothetical protein J2P12_05355, partial [Candidatus Bathyarchaeota archaeon]|nr:hypothetical protein [Candidatus Bathyarchaeota archaeon]
AARFGDTMERKAQLDILLQDALVKDEIVDLARDRKSTQLVIGNILGESSITAKFPIIDW